MFTMSMECVNIGLAFIFLRSQVKMPRLYLMLIKMRICCSHKILCHSLMILIEFLVVVY